MDMFNMIANATRPKPSNRVRWDEATAEALSEHLGCGYSDAWGVMAANADKAEDLFRAGIAPTEAAKQLTK